MFLSIIIPVYNVEKYIKRCLLSCLQQNIPSYMYEIIIVNDGTQDDSMNIVNSIRNKEHNITIINKSNGGLSSARNAGLKIAKGDYIWFIDSDDFVEINILKQIEHIITDNNPQVIVLDAEIIYENNNHKEIKKRALTPGIIVSGSEVYHKSFVYPYSGAQFYLYRTSFLKENDLQFIEGKLYEDILFTSQILALAWKCIYIDQVVYYYCIRDGSITNSTITTRHCGDLLAICDNLNFTINKYSDNTTAKSVLYDSIARSAGVFYHYRWRFLKTRQEKKVMAHEFKRRKYWLKAILKSKKFKYLISYLLIR